jgi:diadenosine tetraphosphatase ApaH/serine/threonine PP2A family protein phosphatase
MTTPLGLHGHTHIPMAWVDRGERVEAVAPGPGSTIHLGDDKERVLLNPGSVGQPRDGDPRASWLELDLDAKRGTWHRVSYDIGAVQAAMRDVGLPIRLVERLRYGI